MKVILAVITALALTGCATNYDQYASAQVKIAEANAITAKYKYEALALMGNSGGDAAKVAAIMSLNLQGHQEHQQALQAPKSWQDSALQWASVLVPSLTQMYSINATKATSLAQIDASVKSSANQTGAFVEFGKLINSPTVVTQPAPVVVRPEVVTVKPEIVKTGDPVLVPTTLVPTTVVTVPR